MNKRLNIFAEMHTLYDYRRGLISWLLTEDFQGTLDERKAEGDRLWDLHFAKSYKERRFDYFEYPEHNINRARFDELYAKRSLEHWLFYYPTNFMDDLLKVILEQENLSEKPISIQGLDLHVNIWPYQFDEEDQANFIAYCKTAFRGMVNVKIMNIDSTNLTPLFYRQFAYVFKYDLMMSQSSEALNKTLSETPIPDTAVIVPDILIQESEHFTGLISDRIHAVAAILGLVIKLVPINHRFYDYRDA